MKFKDVPIRGKFYVNMQFTKVNDMCAKAEFSFGSDKSFEPGDNVFVKRKFGDLNPGSIFNFQDKYYTKAMVGVGIRGKKTEYFEADTEVWSL